MGWVDAFKLETIQLRNVFGCVGRQLLSPGSGGNGVEGNGVAKGVEQEGGAAFAGKVLRRVVSGER